MSKSILITGASGLIGTRLTEVLLKSGHRVSHIGRTKMSKNVPVFQWDIGLGILDPKALASTDTIIHLAGAGIADRRWTKKRKDEILRSRIHSTELLFKMLKKGTHRVKTFISASAIGYYGPGSCDDVFTEMSPPGNDFLAAVTRQWEDEVDKMAALNIRVVKIRIGIVLSKKGGALRSMVWPVQLGLGAALGSGKQCISWIHIDDLCALLTRVAIDDQFHGVYNGVSLHPVSNLDMTKAIAQVLKRPLWLPPVPGFALQFILGEMANLVLQGSHVSPEKMLKTGFTFRFTTPEDALHDLLLAPPQHEP